MPLNKLRHRWITSYKPKPDSKAPSATDSRTSHTPDPALNVRAMYIV